MRLYLILVFFLVFTSCKQTENKDSIAKVQLNETNLLLERNLEELNPKLEQIFYKRCKNTNNFHNEVRLILNDLDNSITLNKELMNEENISKHELENLKNNYIKATKNIDYFANNVKEWKVNSYKTYRNNYSQYGVEYFPELLVKMQNDLLLNKASLYDFILFYSVCKHKASSFIVPTARDNQLNVSSTNKFHFELICAIPEGKDILQKQIKNFRITKKAKQIQLRPEINYIYSDTSALQAVLRFENLEEGSYLAKGDFVISRLNENSKDTIQIIMPFEFDLIH